MNLELVTDSKLLDILRFSCAYVLKLELAHDACAAGCMPGTYCPAMLHSNIKLELCSSKLRQALHIHTTSASLHAQTAECSVLILLTPLGLRVFMKP